MFSKRPEDRSPPAMVRAVVSSGSTFSVIGPDVVIKGDVIATADLHIDGKVTGDITCASLVQGESSSIHGAIKAESARLAGTVCGTIAVSELVILKAARIEGDVDYDTLTIEQGAAVEGRISPAIKRAAAMPAKPRIEDEPKGDGEPRLTLAG